MAKEYQGAYEQYRGDHEAMQPIRHSHEMAKQHGTTRDKALTNYVSIEQKLRQDVVGGLDIIVNNAGYTWDSTIQKMTDEQFQAMLDIHTIVPFRICRAAAPHMREPAKQEREEGRHAGTPHGVP